MCLKLTIEIIELKNEPIKMHHLNNNKNKSPAHPALAFGGEMNKMPNPNIVKTAVKDPNVVIGSSLVFVNSGLFSIMILA